MLKNEYIRSAFIQTLSGPYMSKVDSLAFTIKYPDEVAAGEVPSWSNLRLFSAGGGSELAEWDIENGTIRVCDSLRKRYT